MVKLHHATTGDSCRYMTFLDHSHSHTFLSGGRSRGFLISSQNHVLPNPHAAALVLTKLLWLHSLGVTTYPNMPRWVTTNPKRNIYNIENWAIIRMETFSRPWRRLLWKVPITFLELVCYLLNSTYYTIRNKSSPPCPTMSILQHFGH